MDSLFCSLEGRPFNIFLSGLSKRSFFGELEYTNEYIADQLFKTVELGQDEIFSQIDSFEQVLLKAAEYNWDSSTLEDKMKRLTNIESEHLKALVSFWSHERDKIHAQKIKDCKWNHSYKNFSFRIDVEAMTKNGSETGEPIALMEFTTIKQKDKSHTAKFEMNRTQINEMLNSLNEIQKKLDDSSF